MYKCHDRRIDKLSKLFILHFQMYIIIKLKKIYKQMSS